MMTRDAVDSTPPASPATQPASSGRNLRIDGADCQLAERVHLTLLATGRLPLAKVSALADGGHVTLRGAVPTYYMKQLAQHAAQHVSGVTKIDCQIAVLPRFEQ